MISVHRFVQVQCLFWRRLNLFEETAGDVKNKILSLKGRNFMLLIPLLISHAEYIYI